MSEPNYHFTEGFYGNKYMWNRTDPAEMWRVPDEIHVPTADDVFRFGVVDAYRDKGEQWAADSGHRYERKSEH